MKTVKYLAALFTGTFFYVLVSITCGQNGIWAQNQLLEQKRIISAHTAQIQSINDELHLEKTAIRDDRDVIAAYARKLDYVFSSENIVKIKGLGSTQVLMYDTGSVLKSTRVQYVPEWICKACGLLTGGLLFCLIFLFDISRGIVKLGNKRHFETINGIPIYDIPQI